MTHEEKRSWLIERLLAEQPHHQSTSIPTDEGSQKRLLRSLMNVRPPKPMDEDFLTVQDEYLREAAARKHITDAADLAPLEPGVCLWQGDITALKCGAIVNAANSGLTGCYVPCHNCIDNCIHTYAGIRLRLACAELMERQGHAEPTGQAKITPAYALPCNYVLHTVGPIVDGPLTDRHKQELASCYRACLALAQEHHVDSVAFCCVSTGVFGFPRPEAARIAVDAVRRYKKDTKVIFNVHNDTDYALYRQLLG